MMSERLRSRDPKSNANKCYTMFFEDEKFGQNNLNNSNSSVSSNSGSLSNNNCVSLISNNNSNNNNNNNTGKSNNNKKQNNFKKQLPNSTTNSNCKFNRETSNENCGNLMENVRKRKYDKIKSEEEDYDEMRKREGVIEETEINTNNEIGNNVIESNINFIENDNNEGDILNNKRCKIDNNIETQQNDCNNIEPTNMQQLNNDVTANKNNVDDGGIVARQDKISDPDSENIESFVKIDILQYQNDVVNTVGASIVSAVTANDNQQPFQSASSNEIERESNNNYADNMELLRKIKYDDTREIMYKVYQPWVLQTYGDSAKTKTITLKKQERIIKTLQGQEANNPDSSKFRFWVKSKGFTTEKPKEFKEIEIDRTNLSNEQRLEDKNVCLLYVPNFSKDATAQPYRKVAVVEHFFDIIFEVHVGLGGKSGRHAGQKRTYRTISESYAFLPREAVTKFLSGCILCRKFPLRTFSSITSKFIDDALTDSSTEFNENNSPKSEISLNSLEVIEDMLTKNPQLLTNSNALDKNKNSITNKLNDDVVKLSVDWEEEINLETSKSAEKKFVTNINNINSKIENELHEFPEGIVFEDKSCLKNITITNELMNYYHLLKQFYDSQNNMNKPGLLPINVTRSPQSSVTSTSTTSSNFNKSLTDMATIFQQQQNNLRQIRLPQKNIIDEYKNKPSIDELSDSKQQSQSLIDLTITKSPSPLPQSSSDPNDNLPRSSSSPSSSINNININMNNFDNLSINVSTTNDNKNNVKILCNKTPPKKRYYNYVSTTSTLATTTTPSVSSTSTISSTTETTSSSATSSHNENLKFMNNLFKNENNLYCNNETKNNNNNLIFKQKHQKIENIIKKCESKNQQKTLNNNNNINNNSNKNNNSNNNNITINSNNNNNQKNNNNNKSDNNSFIQLNPITSTYLKMTRSMGLSDDDALKFDELVALIVGVYGACR